jgi:hypothetical protein
MSELQNLIKTSSGSITEALGIPRERVDLIDRYFALAWGKAEADHMFDGALFVQDAQHRGAIQTIEETAYLFFKMGMALEHRTHIQRYPEHEHGHDHSAEELQEVAEAIGKELKETLGDMGAVTEVIVIPNIPKEKKERSVH